MKLDVRAFLLATSFCWFATQAFAVPFFSKKEETPSQPQPLNMQPNPANEGGSFALPKLPWFKDKSAATVDLPQPIVGKYVSPEQRLEGQLSLARLTERRGQVEQAEQLYVAIAESRPTIATPKHRLGVIEAKRGHYDKADQHFQAALRLEPNNVDLLRDAGYCCYLQNRYEEAEDLLKRAFTQSPNDKAVCNNLGLVLAETGRIDEALIMFRKATSEAEAYANVGYVFVQLGQIEEARKHFNYALTLNPELRNAAHALLQIAEQQERVKLAGLAPNQQKAAPIEQVAEPTKRTAEATETIPVPSPTPSSIQGPPKIAKIETPVQDPLPSITADTQVVNRATAKPAADPSVVHQVETPPLTLAETPLAEELAPIYRSSTDPMVQSRLQSLRNGVEAQQASATSDSQGDVIPADNVSGNDNRTTSAVYVEGNQVREALRNGFSAAPSNTSTRRSNPLPVVSLPNESRPVTSFPQPGEFFQTESHLAPIVSPQEMQRMHVRQIQEQMLGPAGIPTYANQPLNLNPHALSPVAREAASMTPTGENSHSSFSQHFSTGTSKTTQAISPDQPTRR